VKEYQLVRITTENSLGWYDTEEAALENIANEVSIVGADKATRNVALHRVTTASDEVIAAGEALVSRALERFPQRRSA